jgi:hypothetical protein
MLIIHRIAARSHVTEEAQSFINSLSSKPGFVRGSQRFDSVQFVTSAVADMNDRNKVAVLYEAYILYYED